MDAGEGRFLDGAFQPVVKADERHILGNMPPGLLESLQRSQCRLIVAGQHRREARPGRHDLLHRRVAARIDVPPVGNQTRIGHQAIGPQRELVSPEPLPGIAAQVLPAAGDEGNALVAVLDQMQHRFQDAGFIIGHDRRAGFTGTDKDHGVSGGDQILDVAGARFNVQWIDHDQAVGVPGADRHKIGLSRGKRPGRA